MDDTEQSQPRGGARPAGQPREEPLRPGTSVEGIETEAGTVDATTVDRGDLILQGLRGLAGWSWRFLLVVAALAVVLYLLAQVWVGVLPILLSLIVSSVLWPPVRWLRRHRVPPALASVLVLLGSLLVIGGVLAAVSPAVAGQVREVGTRASEGLDAILDWLSGPPVNLQSEQLTEYVDQAAGLLQSRADDVAGWGLSTLTTVGSIMITLGLTLVLTFFFLKDGPGFLPWLRRATGRKAGMHLTESLSRVWSTLGGFLRGQAIVAAVDAVFIGLGLLLLGVPLALPLAVLTFVLSFIPILGAFVAGALAVLVALVTEGFTIAVWTLVLVLAVQQAESALVSPTVQSRAVSMHPVLVLLGVSAGGTLWGILGAFLAVPVLACVLAAIRYGNEQLDLRTGTLRMVDVRNLTPEGLAAAAEAERSAPIFAMRAQQAYLQAEDERGAAQVALLERTNQLAATLKDRFLNPILRRGDAEDDPDVAPDAERLAAGDPDGEHDQTSRKDAGEQDRPATERRRGGSD